MVTREDEDRVGDERKFYFLLTCIFFILAFFFVTVKLFGSNFAAESNSTIQEIFDTNIAQQEQQTQQTRPSQSGSTPVASPYMPQDTVAPAPEPEIPVDEINTEEYACHQSRGYICEAENLYCDGETISANDTDFCCTIPCTIG